MKDNEYKCSACGGVFEKAWTDEEAQTEYAQTFDNNTENQVIVCDDCYNQIMNFHGHKPTTKS